LPRAEVMMSFVAAPSIVPPAGAAAVIVFTAVALPSSSATMRCSPASVELSVSVRAAVRPLNPTK
jgi:hypothetical protein